jgi:hypothetical protein
MSNVIIESQTGPDGTLHLDVPLGPEKANQPVRIIISPSRTAMTADEWAACVQKLAGSVADPTFVRPPQLPLEDREPL